MPELNHCYYRLNLDIREAINKSWTWPRPKAQTEMWSVLGKECFNKDWLTYVHNLGLNFSHILLFYRAPYVSSRHAHIDIREGDFKPINFAVNWIIGGAGSKMNWYSVVNDNSITATKDSETRAPYKTYQLSDLELIETCEINDAATLVKTDLPHSITMGHEPRWCISTRVYPQDNITWDEIINRLESKGLLVRR
jgi:hypothetical protein